MDNKSFEIQVLERLTAIETTLKQQDYKAINEKLNQTENRSINNKERIEKIEDNAKWLWRSIGGAVIVLLLELVVGAITFFNK